MKSIDRIYRKKVALSDLKGEYAKVYSWGINHFRSVFSGFLQEFLP